MNRTERSRGKTEQREREDSEGGEEKQRKKAIERMRKIETNWQCGRLRKDFVEGLELSSEDDVVYPKWARCYKMMAYGFVVMAAIYCWFGVKCTKIWSKRLYQTHIFVSY